MSKSSSLVLALILLSFAAPGCAEQKGRKKEDKKANKQKKDDKKAAEQKKDDKK